MRARAPANRRAKKNEKNLTMLRIHKCVPLTWWIHNNNRITITFVDGKSQQMHMLLQTERKWAESFVARWGCHCVIFIFDAIHVCLAESSEDKKPTTRTREQERKIRYLNFNSSLIIFESTGEQQHEKGNKKKMCNNNSIRRRRSDYGINSCEQCISWTCYSYNRLNAKRANWQIVCNIW